MNLELKFQGNIGIEITNSVHHHRKNLLNLHTDASTAFSNSLRMEASSKSTKLQEKEDMNRKLDTHKHKWITLNSSSLSLKKINEDILHSDSYKMYNMNGI